MIKFITSKNGNYHNLGLVVTLPYGNRYFPLSVVGKNGMDPKQTYRLWKLIAENVANAESLIPDEITGIVFHLESADEVSKTQSEFVEVLSEEDMPF